MKVEEEGGQMGIHCAIYSLLYVKFCHVVPRTTAGNCGNPLLQGISTG